ncbi:hypothetical protein A2761_01800 [Candidatus Kaiserbacteria bacterium RIFCSPHIGHO2_01_FULL_51_33]|nr:MAG: hypothetical protein A2761_01800 [Candidatus Kaiserbacteria bacterium RIFCSPHIGHO2_01_FULL_51_33]
MSNFLRFCIIVVITAQARAVLRKYKPTIVAVTGSVGKTSTKDALYTVLGSSFFVRKSEKSFNSDIGIPLTILGRPNGWNNPLVWLRTVREGLALLLLPNHYPKWLVLEVGADRPGDIKRITRWLKPDIAVMTLLPAVPVHVEFFKTPEELVAEKQHLLTALKPDGIAIISEDDETARSLVVPEGARRVTFGFSSKAEVRASNEETVYEDGKPVGIRFRVKYTGESSPVRLHGVLGRQHIYPVLASVAAGVTQGITLARAAESLKTHEFSPGRMRILAGKNDSLIIDDSYNSSPVAVEEALHTLGSLEIKGRKIALLGDMLELGSFSPEEHRRIGVLAAQKAELLWTVGLRAKTMGEAAVEAGFPKEKTRHFIGSREAGNALAGELRSGDAALVKGSQSIRMERAVERAMREPHRASELLVRQESAWRRR